TVSTLSIVAEIRTPRSPRMAKVLGIRVGFETQSYSRPHRRGQEPRQGPREAHGAAPSLTPEQQKEAIRRRAQGATLEELAHSYKRQPRDDFTARNWPVRKFLINRHMLPIAAVPVAKTIGFPRARNDLFPPSSRGCGHRRAV